MSIVTNNFNLININSLLYDIIIYSEIRDVRLMLILAKSILALFIGFILSIIIGLVFIPLMKKEKAEQVTSKFIKAHKNKSGTPTMGGLIFIFSTLLAILVMFLTKKMEITTNLFIVLFVFISYGVLGFIDDFLKIKYKSNERGLSRIQKFIGQVVIAIIFFILYVRSGADTSIEVAALNIHISLGFFYGFFILFMLVGSSNAVNLTDGLDGLASGLSIICFLIYGMIAWNSPYLAGSDDIAIFCFILAGSLLGFLVYNSHPAKIFMGDTGSLSLGATLATVAILTHREFSLIVIGGVFVIETLSVILQIGSIKLTRKKLFPMTPIHHTFEKKGWSEVDIVRLFYVVGFILGAGALIYTVWV